MTTAVLCPHGRTRQVVSTWRQFSRPAIAVALLLFASRADAQRWSVNLFDIHADGPATNQVRAESVEFLPDGQTLAIAGYFYDGKTQQSVGEIWLFNTADGSLRTTLSGKAVSYALRAGSLACSRSGRRIAAAGRDENNDRIVDVFDVSTLQYMHTLKGDPSPTTCVVFSPDEKTLAAAHRNGTIDLWNPESGRRMSSFVANHRGIWPIAFSPDDTTLAAGQHDGGVTLFTADGGRVRGRIDRLPGLSSVGAVTYSKDGRFLATGGTPSAEGRSPVHIWTLDSKDGDRDTLTAQRVATLNGHQGHTYSLAFSPDGRLLASANQDGTVMIYDVRTGQEHCKPITQHTDFVYDVAFSPDGTKLATLGRDSLKLWNRDQLQD